MSTSWFRVQSLTARFERILRTPLRWPKVTTRRLMLLVAVVAVLLWGGMEMPDLIDRAIALQDRAVSEAYQEKSAEDEEHKRLTAATAIQGELERWRRRTGLSDPMTERYFTSQYQSLIARARHDRELAAYHATLKKKYRWVRWFPWQTPPRDPASPVDPPLLPPEPYDPGKIVNWISTEGCTSVSFLPDGRGLVVGCKDDSIRFLEVPSRRVLASTPIPDRWLHRVTSSPDGKLLVALGASRDVWRWDFAAGGPPQRLPWTERSADDREPALYLSAAAIAPTGQAIAVAGGGSKGRPPKEFFVIRLLDAGTGALRWERAGLGNAISSLAFAPDGRTIACGQGAVLLLDARSGHTKQTLKPVAGYVLGVAFSPDGRILAGCGSNSVPTGGFGGEGRVTLWDVATGAVIRTLEGPTGRAQAVAFSPDGSRIAAGGTGPMTENRSRFLGKFGRGNTSEVKLWEVSTGRAIWSAEGVADAAFSLAFAPDGKTLAFCDQEYLYWIDAESGQLKQIVMESVWTRQVRDRPPAKTQRKAEQR